MTYHMIGGNTDFGGPLILVAPRPASRMWYYPLPAIASGSEGGLGSSLGAKGPVCRNMSYRKSRRELS